MSPSPFKGKAAGLTPLVLTTDSATLSFIPTPNDVTANEIYDTLMSDMRSSLYSVFCTLDMMRDVLNTSLEVPPSMQDWRDQYIAARTAVENHRDTWLSFKERSGDLSAPVRDKIDRLDSVISLLRLSASEIPDEAHIHECLSALFGDET